MTGIVDHYLDAKWNEDMLGPTERQHPRFMDVPPGAQAELDAARAEFERIPKNELERMKREFGHRLIEDDPTCPDDLSDEIKDSMLAQWQGDIQRREAGRHADAAALKIAGIGIVEAEKEGLSFAEAVAHTRQRLEEAETPRSKRQVHYWLHELIDNPKIDCNIPPPVRGRPRK